MGLKILVWSSLLFLFGGIAVVTYLIYFSGSPGRYGAAYEIETRNLRYVVKRQDYDSFSINQLDSLSAAENFRFTQINATKHSLNEL